MIRFVFPLLLILPAGLQGGGAPDAPLPAESHGGYAPDAPPPDDPLSTFELHPEFQIELIASEPLVADPIDMEIDEFGRLYVLEFHSYPDRWTGVDRIKMLRDTDHDGTMDESVIFADSLVQAMGIMRWKAGLIVTTPPDVIYLEDSDDDGRADVRRILLSGFHRGDGEGDVNNPQYGLDNWIYLGNRRFSDEGIYFAERPDGPRIPPEGTTRNIRFRPDTYEIEAQSSSTQYGFTFDRWGHQLLNHNRDHIFQEIIAARYLARNPNLLVTDASESISDHGAAAKVFPITTDPDYQILTDVGEITSACGITFYDGGIFPAGFENVSFVAEPAHNLVHVDRIRRGDPALTAGRVRPHNEFLASTDASFRPVNMYVGPDGALYVVDYYRKIIEGPEWIADEVLQSGTLYDGTDMGRIYRITPTGTGPPEWTAGLDLGDVSAADLARRLADANIWWRRNAQRLLIDRGGREVVQVLEEMVRDAPPVGRLHALWTLEGLGALDDGLILHALEDAEPGIRENAIRLAERRLDPNSLHQNERERTAASGSDADRMEAMRDALFVVRSDADDMVRFQLLLTLGIVDSPRAAEVREELLFGDIDNEWMQIAALSSPFVEEGGVLETVIDDYRPEYASFVRRLSMLAGVNRPRRGVDQLLEASTDAASRASWQAPVLEGLAQGLDARDELPEDLQLRTVVAAFFDHPSAPVRRAALDVLRTTGLPSSSDSFVQRAARMAADVEAPAERRVQAIRLVALDDPARHVPLLTNLIDPGEPTIVQMAAFDVLGAAPGTAASSIAVSRWPVLTSQVRDAAISAVLDRPFQRDRIEELLRALGDGTIQPANINWGHKVTLMRDIPDDLKARARNLITGPDEQVREQTAEYVRLVEQKTPDPERGRAVFYEACARCHALGDVAPGAHVGPDLMSVRGWAAADVVDHVVRPNDSITRGYELWQVVLQNGETIEGMIASETANAVALRNAAGEVTTYSRRNIESLTNLDASVMPSDFGDLLSHQEMADLAAFIRTGE